MRILITGNRGFVGSVTQRLLEESKHEVIGFDIMDNKDIRDVAQLEKCVQEAQPDRILHLAAIARFAESDKDPKLAYETNALGTLNVARVAAKYHIPLVYASTGSCYAPIKSEPPITEEFPVIGNSVYGCSKALGEIYVKNAGNPYIILRYSHLIGAEKRYHGLVGGFIDRIERGLAPQLHGGSQSNDFLDVRDVAEANLLALTTSWDKYNQAYNIGTGVEMTAEEAGKIVCKHMGYKGKIEKTLAREVDPKRFVFSTKKAEVMLGFKSKHTFEDGVKFIVQHMKNGKK